MGGSMSRHSEATDELRMPLAQKHLERLEEDEEIGCDVVRGQSSDGRSERVSGFGVRSPTPRGVVRGGTTLTEASGIESLGDVTTVGGSSKNRALLDYGAVCMVWIIGLWTLVKLLREFDTALKPLVLAALFVSILEYVVQLFEHLFKQVWTLVRLIVQKCWVLFRIILRELLHCICFTIAWARGKDFASGCCGWKPNTEKFTDEDVLYGQLFNFRELLVPWHASMAGRYMLYRVPAVLVTLLLVFVVVLFMNYLLLNNVKSMIKNLNGYKDQLVRIIVFAKYRLDKLPHELSFLPAEYQESAGKIVQQWESSIDFDSMVQNLQVYVLDILNGVLSYSRTFLFELLFFLLYSFLWLFDPLHINPNEDLPEQLERNVQTLHRRSIFKFTRSDTLRKVIDKSAPLFELQAHLNNIMWQYFFLKCIMNGTFAFLVWGLLGHLNVDLPGFIAVACFFLGFIPELGTIISIGLPVPLIILAPPSEGTQMQSQLVGPVVVPPNPWPDWNMRVEALAKAILGMCMIKILVSNMLEAWVMGRNKVLAGAIKNHEMDKIRETHPVAILFAVVICGDIWGQVGMLISVPVISLIRLTLNVWSMDVTTPEEKTKST